MMQDDKRLPTVDEELGIRSEKDSGTVRRYRCGCSSVRVGRGLKVQLCLTCPGGPEHLRPLPGEAEQGALF